MSTPLNEPSYRVFQGNDEVTEANPGTGVMLPPGFYEVFIGSGSIAQMMSRTVEVREGMTTLVKPFWSGLVINVIDANRTSVNESYELYWQDQQENYGIGFGIEEERRSRKNLAATVGRLHRAQRRRKYIYYAQI